MQTYKLLESDKIHLIQPILVERYGRIQAEFLSQLHYWTKKEQGLTIEGKTWVYNTYKQWADQFKISSRHMVRIINDLIKQGVVQVQKLATHKSNRTNYYSLDYDVINELQTVENPHCDKLSQSCGQNVTMVIHRITNKEINNKSEGVESVLENSCHEGIQEQVGQVKKSEFKNEKEENNRIKTHKHSVSQSPLILPCQKHPLESTLNTTVQDMLAYWNKWFPDAQTVLSKDLAKLLMGAFIHRFDKDIDKWKFYCDKINSSPYLMGEKFILRLTWALRFSIIDRILKGDFGVKDFDFKPSEQALEKKAIQHIEQINESDACKKDRYLILKKLGASTYVAWFTQVDFIEQDGRVLFKAKNLFIENYINQNYRNFLK